MSLSIPFDMPADMSRSEISFSINRTELHKDIRSSLAVLQGCSSSKRQRLSRKERMTSNQLPSLMASIWCVSPTRSNSLNPSRSRISLISLLLTVLHSSTMRTSTLLVWLDRRYFAIVINSQLLPFMRRRRLSTAGFVLASAILGDFERMSHTIFISVVFPVPADP